MKEGFLKFLRLLFDFLVGCLFPLMAVGFMLLVAAGMIYFHPEKYFTNAGGPLSSDSDAASAARALGWLKLGIKLILIPALLLWLKARVEAWWKARPKKSEAPSPPKDAA